MIDLLDVNVWLALVDENHVHHDAAQAYWQRQAAESVAFCRVSLLGFLRLATHRGVLSQPLTPREAWAIVQRYLAEPDICLLQEPPGVDETFIQWTLDPDFAPSRWTDAYLAAFAQASGGRMVSFDADFDRFAGLHFLRLEPNR
jgi:toxin-antitoxin system PIN domain toxin